MTTGPASAAAVLWDIDGTLLTSGGVAAGAFLDAVEDVTGVPADIAGIDFGGRIDPEIAGLLLAAVGQDVALAPAVLVRHAELVAERADAVREHIRVLAGVEPLLSGLAAAGIPQTVVTGNVRSVALLKLAAAHLVPPIDPARGGYGDSGRDRVEVAEVALLRLFGTGWPEFAGRTWIIGDTPRDLACAQALGLRCALVGTGRRSVQSLTGIGADLVLADLAEPAGLERLWATA